MIDDQTKEMDAQRRLVKGWLLFDFANSISAVIGGIFFAQWFVSGLESNSFQFNLMFLIAAILVVLAGPFLGRLVDSKKIVRWMFMTVLGTAACIFSIVFAGFTLAGEHARPIVFVAFVCFLLFYQTGRICHNTLLKRYFGKIEQERLSGLGTTANWLGSIFGILAAMPIVLVVDPPNSQLIAFLLAGILTLLLGIVSVGYLSVLQQHRLPDMSKAGLGEGQLQQPFRSTLSSLGLVGLAYFLLFDAMAMVQRNLPPYLTEIVEMTEEIQSLGFLLILLSAAGGGYYASRKIGYHNSTKAIRLCSILLAISIFLVAFGSLEVLFIAFVIAGSCYGLLEASIRLDFMARIGSSSVGASFGVFAAIERTSGVIGPLIWLICFQTAGDLEMGYRSALLAMAASCLFASMFMSGQTKKTSQ